MLGCEGSPLPPTSNIADSKPILIQALDAWKKGEKPTSLAALNPPIQVLDSQWDGGWALVSYADMSDGVVSGVNVQHYVHLELKSPKGKTVKKTANFLVTTSSHPVVTRQDQDGD